MNAKIVINKISSQHPELKMVIKSSIGNPADEKIDSVLSSYKDKGVLIGAFVSEKLLGCCGYEINANKLIIKHLSVIKDFQENGIGSQLVKHIMAFEDCDLIIADTDNDALDFYNKLNFQCKKIDTEFDTDRFQCTYLKKRIAINSDVEKNLQDLSKKINEHYGFVTHPGENLPEAVINFGPCGPFANEFYKSWNSKFQNRVKLAFVMQQSPAECYHILIVLPNGNLYDGGNGIHSEKNYLDRGFHISVMDNYNFDILDQHSYGLDRKYPRYCPNFNVTELTSIVENSMRAIYFSLK